MLGDSIKSIKTFKQYFFESSLRSLYHFSELYNIASICSENKFKLTFSGSSDVEKYKFKYNYFLSLSRIPTGIYGYKEKTTPIAFGLIEMDYQKLSDKFVIKPFHYWKTMDDGGRRKESEDRLFSNKPTIDNAKKYIICVHVYLPKIEHSFQKMVIDEINLIAHSGVDYWIYPTPSDLYARNPKKRYKLGDDYQYSLNFDSSVSRTGKNTPKYVLDDAKEMKQILDWIENPSKETSNYSYYYLSFITDTINLFSRYRKDHNKYDSIQTQIHRLANLIKTRKKSLEGLIKTAWKLSEEFR